MPLTLYEETLLPGQEGAARCAAESWRFFQVAEGVAYWLGSSERRELAVGELAAVAPQVGGVVRASQIGETRVRHFCFNPRSVIGLFSLAERVGFARHSKAAVLFFPPSHQGSQLMAQAPVPDSPRTSLTSRANLLHLALLVLAAQAPGNGAQLPSGASARRFSRLASESLDVALLSHSTQEIAELCGCTRRHLNSLWHRELGCNIRSTQRELRLQLARELIEQTAGRISEIALSVGFTSVSRFNAAFKRQFGCTPTQCRSVVTQS